MHLLSVGQQVGVATTSTFGTYASGGVSFLFSDSSAITCSASASASTAARATSSTGVNYFNRTSRWNWGLFAERVPLLSGTAAQGVASKNGAPVIVEQVDLFRQTYNQIGATVAYPFDRATRVEFGVAGSTSASRTKCRRRRSMPLSGNQLTDTFTICRGPGSLNLIESSAAVVRDTAAFGVTSPIRGERERVEVAPTFGDLNITSVTADYGATPCP